MICTALAINWNRKLAERGIRRFKKRRPNTKNPSGLKGLIHIRTVVVFAVVAGLALSQWGLIIHSAYGSTTSVNIQNFAFNLQSLTLDQGEPVTWTNNDPVIYTLWFVNATDNSTYALSPPLNPGGTYSLTFPSPGAIKYYSFERQWITGTISINPLPLVVSINVSPNPTVGNAVTFTGLVSRGTTPYSYSWSFGDGSIGTGNPAGYVYSSSGTFTVALTATDARAATQSISSTVSVAPVGGGGGSGHNVVL